MCSSNARIGLTSLALTAALGSSVARAQTPSPETANPTVAQQSPPPIAAPAPPPAPYSLPWQLRPAAVGTVLRSDTSVAFYENPALTDEKAGSTIATTLLGTYKITPNLAPLARVAFVQNKAPGPTLGSGSAFVNPILGMTYGNKFGTDFRYSAMLAATLPIGMGGDKAPGMDATAAAAASGIAARSGMDNAMFAVNYFTAIGGFDLAYVAHKVTLQAEVTLLQLMRARNENVPSAADSSRTNLTAGFHAGVFLAPFISLGGELRYQRWLSTPKAVEANPAARDTLTFAAGPRFHFKIANTWLRPGLSYSRGLDNPLADQNYNVVQLDVPVIF